ncbi:MAG: LysR family transcriptional regulator [Gemmatimonadaceae bacterium]|nr:LysR family transcriptional regulator [Acetobacteraceae bacterium]
MRDVEDLRAFQAVAETCSVTQGAKRLGASKASVSRRVAALEAVLGARLLIRTSQGVSLSDVGATFLERTRQILADLDDAADEAAGVTGAVSGRLRLAAPTAFGEAVLMPVLADLMHRHPRLEIDLHLDDARIDLVRDGFDVALRLGILDSSDLVARRIAPMSRVVVCSPGYAGAHGIPHLPADIAGHAVLLYANRGPGEVWRFRDRTGEFMPVRPRTRLRVNNATALRQGAEAGLGLAILPLFVAASPGFG